MPSEEPPARDVREASARAGAEPGKAAGESSAVPFRLVCDITPRFRDSDAMGHINNAVYVTYLEVARQEYWKRLYAEADYRQVPFILAHVTCDFRSEALIKETLEARLRCAWIGSKSFAFVYEIREKLTGRLVVEATTVQVCYDYTTKRSIPMPDGLRRALEAFEGRTLSKAVEAS
jgi:acyl-CoA thioester hydrolase